MYLLLLYAYLVYITRRDDMELVDAELGVLCRIERVDERQSVIDLVSGFDTFSRLVSAALLLRDRGCPQHIQSKGVALLGTDHT